MQELRGWVRRMARAADNLSGFCLLLIVLLNLAAVFMRYVMRDSISWSEEGIRYIAIWMTFMGAAAASWLGEHMDMDLLGEFGGARFQAWRHAALHALTAIFAGFVLWQGAIYLYLNAAQTAPATGLPKLYVYSAIAIGGFMLLVISLIKIVDCFAPPAEIETGQKIAL